MQQQGSGRLVFVSPAPASGAGRVVPWRLPYQADVHLMERARSHGTTHAAGATRRPVHSRRGWGRRGGRALPSALPRAFRPFRAPHATSVGRLESGCEGRQTGRAPGRAK